MKLLRLSFAQSKKVVADRKDLFNDNDEEKNVVTLGSRFISLLAVGAFIIMMIALGLAPADTPAESYGDYFLSGDTALAVQLISMDIYTPLATLLKALGIYAVAYLLMPFPNILVQRLLALPLMAIFCLVSMLALLPLTLGCAIGNNGSIVTTIWSVLIMVALISKLVNYRRKKLAKVTGQPVKEAKFPKLISVKSFILLSYAISFIQKAATPGKGHLNVVGILIGGAYPLVGLLFVALILPLMLDMFLSWYYIAKYSTQYRLYYQIPDSVWYYDDKRAAKHRPVYRQEKGDADLEKE
ncbi:hypothetical protein [Limosilactobacillus caccae]|uniref:hypothetical protein n=1 Tax=Limosilactobacillus caccae TaxID=1926284 RepID=UPI00097148F2|nr:hypothetical protein [Limosilactobacillus caccae]